MQVPLPHASFPIGDTIPFAVTLLTNEQGQKWEPKRDEGNGFRLEGLLTHESVPQRKWGLGFTPVTGSPGSHLAEWRPTRSGTYPRGLWHYEITLKRIDPRNGYTVLARYTLLRGSLTLY